ncbi:glucosamine-6-phosphate deaminase [Brevundimonas intermedia]|uniref:Glucosamine-6-phosphate deaminase n=1 Tax=Brevundimonas intermedia TaxID=74315 RepID=A0ABQ5TAJ4_9CAUL|nr:SIS domain-containing protein [Brevundimonas intermedia]GLK49834.1 glucosamine-6-phosphate deaminase [Brevundimonas intermedia]
MVKLALTATVMEREALEAADAVEQMLQKNAAVFQALGAQLRTTPPAVVVTVARGSSDHAATYAKYLIEAFVGVPVASAAPSIASVYGAPSAPGSALCLAISQSGRSPDLLASVDAQRAAGAQVVALVNDETSPLAERADTLAGLNVGPELAVAATKSFIASLAGVAALVGAWSENAELQAAVARLPDDLRRAASLDWRDAARSLMDADQLFVIGRGFGLGVAQEAALKLKETCGVQAEAFSAAEVRHGPMAIVGEGFPVLLMAGSDTAGDSVRAVAAEFAARGARTLLADAQTGAGPLPAFAAHPAIEPLLMIQSFYRLAAHLSVSRGLNPDSPPHLRKVTETV